MVKCRCLQEVEDGDSRIYSTVRVSNPALSCLLKLRIVLCKLAALCISLGSYQGHGHTLPNHLRATSFSMDNLHRRRTLLTIQDVARNIKDLMQRNHPEVTFAKDTCIGCPSISIPILDLPFPSNLGPILRTLGLNERAYSETHSKIQQLVHNLQNHHSLKFQHVCRNLVSLPHLQDHSLLASAIEHMKSAYENAYTNHLPLITSQILSAHAKRNSICGNVRTPFNNVSGS